MKQADQIIHARWIVPVVPYQTVLENHALVIQREQIVALLPSSEVNSSYQAKTTQTLADHVLIPGLINAHSHTAMTLLRGLADDLPLMRWLNDYIWPAEDKWVSEAFVADGTDLAIAEMLLSGTTCVNDMYFNPDIAAERFAKAGFRATVGLVISDNPTAWARSQDEYFAKALDVAEQYKSHPLINTAFAPHAPYTVSDKPFRRIATLAEQIQIPIHVHVHESEDEITGSLKHYGVRPIERLKNLGILGPSTIAVHLTQLNDEDIATLAKYAVNAVHCPESNLKLASGFSPVKKMLNAGINIALGTDGAASNNDLDMLGEMKTAALLAKAVAHDAAAVSAYRVLQMATINGAKALGLANETGSLEVGKKADIVAVNMNDVSCQPLDNPVSQLIYSSSRNQVSHVWIAGNHLLNERQLTTVDVASTIEKAKNWRKRIHHE